MGSAMTPTTFGAYRIQLDVAIDHLASLRWVGGAKPSEAVKAARDLALIGCFAAIEHLARRCGEDGE